MFSEAEIYRFHHTVVTVQWCHHAWIDEIRNQVVLVGAAEGPNEEGHLVRIPRLIRILPLDADGVMQGGSRDVVQALVDHNRAAYSDVLKVVIEDKIAEAKPYLPAILNDKSLPPGARLRAAAALVVFGDRQGAAEIENSAMTRSDDQLFAIDYLPSALGDDAAPVLRRIVEKFGNHLEDGIFGYSYDAMTHVSVPAAVKTVVPMLRGSPASVEFALQYFEGRPETTRQVLPQIVEVLSTPPKAEKPLDYQQWAARILGAIGPDAKEALPELIKLAEKHAKTEWDKARDKQPNPAEDEDGERRYSKDPFVDAICRIRALKPGEASPAKQ
jgi:hypothetical protein